MIVKKAKELDPHLHIEEATDIINMIVALLIIQAPIVPILQMKAEDPKCLTVAKAMGKMLDISNIKLVQI